MSFSEEKRKKLIVPAVALMMCAVAMIGIGYAAMTTTVNNIDNTLDVNALSVSLYNGVNKTEVTEPIFTAGNIDYYTQKELKKENDTYSLETRYYLNATAITISDNDTYLKCNYGGDNSLSMKSKATITNDERVSISSITIDITKSGEATQTITLNQDNNFEVGNITIYGNNFYSMVITANIALTNINNAPTTPTIAFTFEVTEGS